MEVFMTHAKERLVQWMRDAHAMEKQAETMLKKEAQRIENYPELKSKVEHHLEETRQQAQRLEKRLDELDGGTSKTKDAMASMMGFAQGMSGMFAGDEVLKGSLANYAFEHMEIASYKMLIATAEEAGDTETKRVCEQNLREEEAMAGWLDEHLGSMTRQFIARESEGTTAKH
jgi:ferritin-like metal-binding protein YciE